MADNGVKITTIDPASVADDILVLRDGSAVRQAFANLATQLAGSGAVSTRLSRAEVMSGYGAVYAVARADLANVESPVNKQGAWVLTTTEDGEKGIWSYSTSEEDWERIADLPISMALLTDVGGTANAITANTLTSPEPSDIRGLLLVPLYPNTDAVTLALDDNDPVSLLSPGGAALTEGALAANVPTVILSDGTNLRIMFPADVVGQVEALRDEINAAKIDTLEAQSAVEAVLESIDFVFFDTVADMVASANLEVGKKVKTLGYFSAGDGGGNTYLVVAGGSGTHDDGSFIDLTGSGLQARAIWTGTVCAETFGCGDGLECSARLQAANDYAVSQSILLNSGGSTTLASRTSLQMSSNIYVKDPVTLGSASVNMDICLLGSTIVATTGGDLESTPENYVLTVKGYSSTRFLCRVIASKLCNGVKFVNSSNSYTYNLHALYYRSHVDGVGILLGEGPNDTRGHVLHDPWVWEWGSAYSEASVAANYIGTGIVINSWDGTIDGCHPGWCGVPIKTTDQCGYYTLIRPHPYCNKAIQTGLDSGGNAINSTSSTFSDDVVSYTDVREDPIAILNESAASVFVVEPYVDGGYVVDEVGLLQITGGFHYMSASAVDGVSVPYTRIKSSAAPGFTASHFRSSFGMYDEDYTTVDDTKTGAWIPGVNGLASTAAVSTVCRQEQVFYESAFTSTPNRLEVSRSSSQIMHRFGFYDGNYADVIYDFTTIPRTTYRVKDFWVDAETLGDTATYLMLGADRNGLRFDHDDKDLNLLGDGTARWKLDGADYSFAPATDNTYSLGSSSLRASVVYSATGTIDTSDENAKANIVDIPDDILDAWGDCGFKMYQFKDAIEAKGEAARLHFGAIAQHFKTACEARGIDPARYAPYCFDKWGALDEKTETVDVLVEPAVIEKQDVVIEPEEIDKEGKTIKPAVIEKDCEIVVKPPVYIKKTKVIREASDGGERYGLRYTELLCLEAAFQRRRAAQMDARFSEAEEQLAHLENRIQAIEASQ